ncbi:glycosyltransferase family 4 protein [Candidatus Kaiserbacteria bacterium]|nr:glycosyltransferase family 4 protein [Candidatus Kaiserbacteria bacterium]
MSDNHMSAEGGSASGGKRILIFSLAYFPKYIGGAEVAIKEITDRNPDIEFHMVTNRFDAALPKVEKIGNVLIHRIGIARRGASMSDLRKWPLNLNKPLFQFLAAWKAFSLHRTHHYDAIWAMMAHSSGIPAIIFKLLHPRVPYILTLQEGDRLEKIERMMVPLWPLFTRVFKRADVVQTISTFLGRWAHRRGFTGRLEVIPNGVDVAHFSRKEMPTVIDALKDSLGKRMGDVFLITTSRLVRKNGIDVVIKALPLLPEHVRFIVLGVGPDDLTLKRLARECKVPERVRFMGEVANTDIPKYLHASDIFVRPSRSEGMGNSFVEAFAAGLPVIGTQEGGIADFLFDPEKIRASANSHGAGEERTQEFGAPSPEYKTGWAVDTDSPEQVAEAVRDIMEHPEKVRAVVATAHALAVEKYDWNTVAKDMREKVFLPILNR